MELPEIKVNHIETKSVMTKSNGPLGGYAVNPYVGCPHACRYCYASFMKRFTGHTEEWGTFMDVKEWPRIKNPEKYAGQKVIIGTVTDGYNPLEEKIDYIAEKHPDLMPLYDEIYSKKNQMLFNQICDFSLQQDQSPHGNFSILL